MIGESTETAMCLWEEIVTNQDGPWKVCRERFGTWSRRSAVAGLARACATDWGNLSESTRDDLGDFDWEFCPFWLAHCVDWDSNPFNGVTLRPDRADILLAEARRLRAEREA